MLDDDFVEAFYQKNSVQVDIEELYNEIKINFIKWISYERFKNEIDAFIRGFEIVFNREDFEISMYTELTARELQIIIMGDESKFNREQWKSWTVFEDGLDEESEQILWFWDVMESMNYQEYTEFLLFAFALPALPISGLNMPFVIKKVSRIDGYIKCNTFFYTIHLPEYPSKEVLRIKLLESMELSKNIFTDY